MDTSLLIASFTRQMTLSEDEISLILSVFTTRKYRKNQYILQSGDLCRYQTFILDGLARTFEVSDTGHEHVTEFGYEGCWVSDLNSFRTGTPATRNIDCLQDCLVMQITVENLDLLYERIPRVERFFRVLLQNALVATTERLVLTFSKPAGQRYEDFLKRFSSIEQRVPDHQIASFLGITPQSLSRIRKQRLLDVSTENKRAE